MRRRSEISSTGRSLDDQSLIVRVIAAGLPLLVIALVAGAIGYATTQPAATAIPPLPPPEAASGARGEVTQIEGSSLTLVTDTGTTLNYTLSPAVSVEVLRRIALEDVRTGDWLNGGAIPHPDTVLALEHLILLPEPVMP